MQDLTALLGSTSAGHFLSAIASGYRKPCFSLQALAEDQLTILANFTNTATDPYFNPLQPVQDFLRSASLDFRDDGSAGAATFVLANSDGRFDRFSDGRYGSPYDDLGNSSGPQQPLLEDRIIRYQKGFNIGNQPVIIPAFYGRVTHVGGNYERMGEQVFNVSCVDMTKHILKRKATSPCYVQWNANSIAADLLRRYGGFIPAFVATRSYSTGAQVFDPTTQNNQVYRALQGIPYLAPTPLGQPSSDARWAPINRSGIIDLTALPIPWSDFVTYVTGQLVYDNNTNSPTYQTVFSAVTESTGEPLANETYWMATSCPPYLFYQVQFPDMGILEMIGDLFGPAILLARCDEAGNFSTTPMLGSPLGLGLNAGDQKGFPDALTEPAVDYVIPDGPLIAALNPTWQDNNFTNQVRVLGQSANLSSGQASSTLESLGPFAQLTTLANASLAYNDPLVGTAYNYGGGSGNQSSLLARAVIMRAQYSTQAGVFDGDLYGNIVVEGVNTVPSSPNPIPYVYFSGLCWRGAWNGTMPGPGIIKQQIPYVIGSRNYNNAVEAYEIPGTIGQAYQFNDVVLFTDGNMYVWQGGQSAPSTDLGPTLSTSWQLIDAPSAQWQGPWYSPGLLQGGVFVKPGTDAISSGQPYYIYNSDAQACGYIFFSVVSVAYVYMTFGPIQFTGGSGIQRGGFGFTWWAWGNPVLNNANALTAYADYNPVPVGQAPGPPVPLPPYPLLWDSSTTYDPGDTCVGPSSGSIWQASLSNTNVNPDFGPSSDWTLGEGPETGDVFGDHITFQTAYTPLAMSQTVEMFSSTDGGETLVSLGQIRADGTILSGTQNYKVDWEQGRLVLVQSAYQIFSEDDSSSNIYSDYPTSFPNQSDGADAGYATTFGNSDETYSGPAINLDSLVNPTNTAGIWTSYRLGAYDGGDISGSGWKNRGDIIYVIPGLTVGQAYNLLLYFAEPNSDQIIGGRIFDVFANGVQVASGLDIYGQVGANTALMIEADGIATDENGFIVIVCTQIQQAYDGTVFPQVVDQTPPNGLQQIGDAQYNGHFSEGAPIIWGIEVQNPTEPGADVLGINCGGPGLPITPATIPTYYWSGGYSPVQQTYGIQYKTVDNPLIATQALAQSVAQYWCDREAWSRFTTVVKCASIPMIQPGDVIQFYHPPLNADFIVYIPEIQRDSDRTSDGSGGSDMDTYTVQIIYVSYRS